MRKLIEILTHEGVRKKYYTVHYLIDNEYIRIYGKFGSLNKANNAAKRIAKKLKVKDIIVS